MAKFQINAGIAVENLCLDSTPKTDGTQRRITLRLNGWVNGKPDIRAGNGQYARVVNVIHNAKSQVSTFTVEAVPNQSIKTYLYDANAHGKDGPMMGLTVGRVTNHDGFKHDLIADLLGRSEDPVKLWVYQRILAADNNKTGLQWKDWDKLLADQPLKQITDPNHPNKWNCGAALNQFGVSRFGGDHYRAFSMPYYKPFRPKTTPARVADIQFDEEKLRRGIQKIRELLEKKIAVTVFVAHNDGFTTRDGIIQQSGNTHFVTIFGCDNAGENFLITDPWPGGSKLLYKSGIFGDVESLFMGRLKVFNQGRLIVASPTNNHGSRHNYVLLTGPS